VANPALKGKSEIYFPPLHIKVGLINKSVKAMDKESKGPAYLRPTFPKTGEANMKEGIFVGPQITSIRRKKLSYNIIFYIKNNLEGILKRLQ
jgi:hypothetical protein